MPSGISELEQQTLNIIDRYFAEATTELGQVSNPYKIAVYSGFIDRFPTFKSLYVRRNDVHIMEKNWDACIVDLTMLNSLAAGNIYYISLLASAHGKKADKHSEKKEYDKAIASYSQSIHFCEYALRANPDFQIIKDDLAIFHFNLTNTYNLKIKQDFEKIAYDQARALELEAIENSRPSSSSSSIRSVASEGMHNEEPSWQERVNNFKSSPTSAFSSYGEKIRKEGDKKPANQSMM